MAINFRLALFVFATYVVSLQAGKLVVAGYLPHYRAGIIDKLQFEKLTDIIFFSISPRADGSLDTTRVKPEVLKKLRLRAHAKNTRVHICVGGWNLSGNFVPMTTNTKARAAFVRNLTTYIHAHQLQGADIDWEHPKGAAQISNYQKLIIELKRAFAPRRLGLTVAVAGWGKYIKPTTIPLIDRFHVMAYDQGTPHAPFAGAVKDLKHWESHMAPKSKLVLGLPFYGRNAEGAATTYAEIIQKNRLNPSEDVADGFHFNGPTTIRRKTNYAHQQGYAGVIIWELGQDASGKASLLSAIRDVLPK